MSDFGATEQIDFNVDKNNLYREESITDLKVASIRRLIPVKSDGTEDRSRTPVFIGHTQLMSPDGPLPIQSQLAANNIEEALDAFPEAMKQALAEVVERIKKMQKEQEQKKNDESRIIMPGS
ncbi:MAG: cytoplasmic protein [Desulfobacteraceae bacterium 4572_123]|nr:MAG: cytoplasmic protein [Desulfobacteraceae bacterium 4572_123]